MTKSLTRRVALKTAMLFGTAIGLIAGGAMAQGFPEREIKIIVPFAAGGTNDSVARIVAESLQTVIGQPVIIENQPGGAGNTGTAAAANADPDGYTMLIQSDSLTTNPLVYPNAGYDAATSFAPVAIVARVPVVLAVHKDVPVATAQEFVDLVQGRPGEITVATPSVGGGNHLTSLYFRDLMGLDWIDVPYPGAGPATTDLLGGHVDAMFAMATSLMPHYASGEIKLLAVSTAERSALLPDIPTVTEATAIEDFAIENWQGLFVPAGTPEDRRQILSDAVIAAVAMPQTQERLQAIGMQPVGEGPDVLRHEIEVSTPRWQEIVDANQIAVE